MACSYIVHEEVRVAAVEGIMSALERNWAMANATLADLDEAILARRPIDQCNAIAWLL
jgi:hypothetical protein